MKHAWLPLFLTSCVYAYDLVREYSGTSFFDSWSFYGNYDNLTNGDVNWLNQSDAASKNLIAVTDAHNAIIRVDNSTNVPFNFKRDSIRITSTDTYQFGTLWVIDVLHLPLACVLDEISVHWPLDGEIDIIEAVNLMTQNQYALHTEPGCVQATPSGQPGHSGSNPDCSQAAGCTVLDTTNQSSFGQAFAQAGGGVWATQFDLAGVFIWFWNRANLPASLQGGAPPTPLDVSAWGPPVASYPSTSCNMSQFFGPQQLVLDITLCGDWAGLPQVYPVTCSSQQPNNPSPPNPPRSSPTCYPDNVPGPGSPRYDDAYFEISHIRAYTTGGPPSASATSSATSVASGGGTTTISTNGGVITLGPADNGIPNSTPTGSASVVSGRDLVAWGVAASVGIAGLNVGCFLI